MDLWVVFLTGLTTGGLTCLAIQSGLLATAMAGQVAVKPSPKHKRAKRAAALVTGVQWSQNLWPVVYFLAAKLAAHTLLGGLLGALGSAFQITSAVQAVMQIGVGLFMLATALNMFNVHPIFRYAVIQPPKAFTRLLRQQSRSQMAFAPAVLGVLTVFIPCGTTQAMMVLAVSTGSPVLGALVLFVFVLGTSPTFMVLGFLATRLRGQLQQVFTLAAAVLILLLGVLSINAGLNVLGSPLAPERLLTSLFGGGYSQPVAAQVVNGVQEVTINARENGYVPSYFSAASGQPLRVRVVTDQTHGCSRIFTIPSLGIETMLPVTGERVFDLPPQPEGYLFFTCSMGMYSGTIRITGQEAMS